MASEIFVDDVEALYGQPRQLHRVKQVDRQVLLDMFPDDAGLIMGAKPSRTEENGRSIIADMITVRESWHLPSGPGAKDGKHVITIDGGTGHVYAGEVPTVEATFSEDMETLLSWADDVARLSVRANADTPEDAARALEAEDQDRIARIRRDSFTGTAPEVMARIVELKERVGVDEMAVVTWCYDEEARRRSYSELARVF